MPTNRLQCFGPEDALALTDWLDKRGTFDPSLQDTVRSILERVEEEGDHALVDYTSRFDCPGFTRDMIRVSRDRIHSASQSIDSAEKSLIQEAISNISSFHRHQKRTSWFVSADKGLITGELQRPVDSAGMYVPGGSSGDTPLVSSLLMTVIPAQIAGVGRICMASPPGSDGELNPYTLAAADMLGIEEIYAVGSAWAVAGMAMGTETLPRVDLIAGPGNIYVTLAKKLLSGRVGIDLLAGPSEIVILADSSANPDTLAADLLSQAEHDESSCALLISGSQDLLDRVERALETQLSTLPRAKTARTSLAHWGGLIRVPDEEAGMELVNRIAPEHLELCLQDPWSWVDRVRHAGAVFLGEATSEALGDYYAGPNHVLPTAGSARFVSGLGVESFCKRSNLISATREYMERNAETIGRLARLEGLEAHARSALRRGSRDEDAGV